MKRVIGMLIVLGLLVALSGCNANDYTSTGESFNLTFEHDDVERDYILYLPEGNYKDAPLLFVLHGYTGNAESVKSYTDFKALADEQDVVVCYPQGLEDNMNMEHWNANLTISNVDDIGFITALADDIVEAYSLDADRVFTCGMSNGGFMSYTLAIHANDTFRAAASVTGIMSGYEWEHRDEATPIPILHIHGTADPVVLPDGTMTTFGGWGGAPSVPEIISFWADVNQCEMVEEQALSETVTAFYYKDGIDQNQVWYYEIDGFGHEWPIEGVNADFNANEVIWEFFSQYEQLMMNEIVKKTLRILTYPSTTLLRPVSLASYKAVSALDTISLKFLNCLV